MNILVQNFLTEYYNNPDPQYAVFLKGNWGCGKTHFIKKWLKPYQKSNNKEDETTITLKPIYVSLYGLRTIDEIKTAIDREINPFFYSKTGKFLKGVANVLGRIVLKTSFDFNKDGTDDATFSGGIDSLSIFHSKDKGVSGDKFIVFDDIERCEVDVKTLLGFINFFVEHCDCHVVVIGDDTKLSDNGKQQLDEFREKTIGREFTIAPDTEEAVDYFLSEPYMAEFLKLERDYIINCFKSAGNDNLRILRQCLMDFSTQLNDITQGVIENGNLFLHGLLGSFIAVYAELNDKDNHEAFLDFPKFYQLGASGLDNENGKRLRALNQKYNEVSQGCIYHVLSVMNVHNIVSHITKGTPMKDYIAKHLNDSKKSYAAWEKLEGFWALDNNEFLAIYNEAMFALLTDKIKLPYQRGTTIGFLGYIDAVGAKQIAKTNIEKIKSSLRKSIRAVGELDELFQVRISLIQGINYVRMSDNSIEMPILDECVATIQKAFERKSKSLPNEMQKALRTLSDNNVGSLFDIDDKTYPDRSTSYQMKSIFEHEDVDDLFVRICSLTNKGKNEFCSFLTKHYMFLASIDKLQNYYSSDKKVLEGLEKRIQGRMIEAKGVDKLAYKRLDHALNKAIQRSKGVTEPLV